ncbi:SprT-like domain-containing protein [Actinomyces marmotae]|uniref:SprT domain-containing protein n=1 Tax=Actinomyces marmotae TaxID=2737173 RepID=A0A6M8B2X3_9ACTO|nr:SprT-like domain-containing protein [Actinomyces marmotae]QKD79020.1 sprT domain-containing protein [Actinomyces marmotae]
MDPHDALALARELMDAHGLGDWGLALDRARRRAGQTDHARRRITLSRALMALYSPSEARETILHEIAHARVGPAHGHDAVWVAEARRLGASGRRLVAPDAPSLPGRWVGICPVGHTVNRMRRPRRPMSCARCSRRFDPAHLLNWELDGSPVAPGRISAEYERALLMLHGASSPKGDVAGGGATGRG